jgi:two-component system sensor histidine kinase HupT/HoxJ
VAHELNNPISFVLGNVHAIRRYAQRLHRYLEEVHAGAAPEDLQRLRAELRIDRIVEDLAPLIEGTVEGADRARQIVDSLKRFSALDREEAVSFDLDEVIERAVHWVQRAGSVRLQAQLDLQPGLRVTGSPGQLQQVLVNIVQNAADAVAGQPEQLIRINAKSRADQAVIEVRDNGPGIAADALAHVFEPFFTTKPVGQGTGLGLSISYGIIERHGGRLTAANHPDGGAIFTITLPRTMESA